MNNAVRFLKTALIYFFGNIFTKVISFILLPLYTSKLSPEQFGYYDLSNSILSLIIPLVFFQIWDGVFRFSFDSESDENKEQIISNAIFIFGIGIIIYILGFSFVYKKIIFSGYIFFSGIIMGLNYFYSFVTRAYMDNKLFVISGAVNSIINMGVNIILISVLNMDVKALYIAMILGGIGQNLLIEIKLRVRKKIKIKTLSKKIMKDLLKFSLPIGIATISYWLLSGFTRLTISENYGILENGLYAVGNRFCGVIVLMTSVLQFAWNEIIYLNVNDYEGKKIQEKAINLMFKITLLVAPAILFLIKYIYPYFVLDVYFESINMIPIIFIGILINSLASFLGTIFLAEKKSNIMSNSTILAAIVNVIFTIIFLKIGVYGPIIALALGFLANLLIRIFVVNKKKIIKIDMKPLILGGAVMSGGILIFYTSNMILEMSFLVIIGVNIVWELNKICKDFNLNIKKIIKENLLSKKMIK